MYKRVTQTGTLTLRIVLYPLFIKYEGFYTRYQISLQLKPHYVLSPLLYTFSSFHYRVWNYLVRLYNIKDSKYSSERVITMKLSLTT